MIDTVTRQQRVGDGLTGTIEVHDRDTGTVFYGKA